MIIAPARAIKLSEIENISHPIMRRGTDITDTVQNLLNYSRPSEEEDMFIFVDAAVLDITNDMMLSKFFTLISKTSYERYVLVANMKTRN